MLANVHFEAVCVRARVIIIPEASFLRGDASKSARRGQNRPRRGRHRCVDRVDPATRSADRVSVGIKYEGAFAFHMGRTRRRQHGPA